MAQRSTGKEPNSVATGGALMRERFIGTAPGKATSKANVGFGQTSLPQCESKKRITPPEGKLAPFAKAIS